MTIRVGVVGCGAIGRAHAQVVRDTAGAELTAVADVDPAAARAVAAAFGTDVVPSPTLADPRRFDMVIVATPPAARPAVVAPLLRNGVAVLCEKPFAADVTAARRLFTVQQDFGTPLAMATKFRFVDEVARTRDLVGRGVLGDLVKVEVDFAGIVDMSRRWNADPEVSGGGVLIDNAVHGIDLVHHLAGPIVEVTAVPGRRVQRLAVEDSATLIGRTDSGAVAQVDVTWSFRRASGTYLTVLGSAATVEVGWEGARVLAAADDPTSFGSGYHKMDALRANTGAFVRTLAGHREVAPPLATAADALASSAVLAAAYASMARGGPVRVEEPAP